MINGARTAANKKTSARLQSMPDKVFALSHRSFKRHAVCQARCDRRRQRTTGAVGIAGLNTRAGEAANLILCHQIIDGLGAATVTAFQQNRAAAEP